MKFNLSKIRNKAFSSFCCLFFLPLMMSAQLTLEPFVSNVFKVTDITHCGDDRLFIVEQAGRIRISDLDGNLNPVPFLSIVNKVSDTGGEQGLLGLAFSPHYSTDRRFYVNYINNSGNTVISRFTATNLNPNVADSINEEILFTVAQPFSNHNGGAMHFGPDGLLYLSLGDGGAGGDPYNNAQNLQVKLGKILRIDVNVPTGYQVPLSNPFIGTAGADSMIWSYGLRNAWRFSFDKITNDMWIADVGQNLWEEINFTPAGSLGGENYGWRCYEGLAVYDTTGCLPASSLKFPVHIYNHPTGCSVTGGYVYRGGRYDSLFGKYFFTDYCSGVIQSLSANDTGGFDHTSYGTFGSFSFTTFGQDQYGELYIGKGSSGVFKLKHSGCMPVAYIADKDTLVHNAGTLLLETPYVPGFTYRWYFNNRLVPGATGNKYLASVSGNYKVIVVSDSGCVNQSKTVMVLLRMIEPFIIYPNPAVNFAEVNWSNNFLGTKTLEIFDITGKLCEKQVLGIDQFSHIINASLYAKGIYIVRILFNDQTFHQKLVIR